MYILLHEWEGSTGEYLVQGWQYWPDRTEAENQIFWCTARPKECYNILIIWPSTSFFDQWAWQ